jgi:hypothetical protein
LVSPDYTISVAVDKRGIAVFEKHGVFHAPDNPSIYIWRYIDLAKYISLLDQRALYFCRADKLDDPFEGSLPSLNVNARSTHPHINGTVTASDGTIETTAAALSRQYRIARTQAFVNCWHMNTHESAAMWQLYCSNTQGIAIRSTYQALCDSFQKSPPSVFVGAVNYIDYDLEPIRGGNTLVLLNLFSPLLHKRRSYQHEAELRAIVPWELPDKLPKSVWQEPKEVGILVPVELDILLESVFVAPNAPTWFFDVVRSVSTKYGLSAPLRYSRLGEAPLF